MDVVEIKYMQKGLAILESAGVQVTATKDPAPGFDVEYQYGKKFVAEEDVYRFAKMPFVTYFTKK
jgi:hypothetical protein